MFGVQNAHGPPLPSADRYKTRRFNLVDRQGMVLLPKLVGRSAVESRTRARGGPASGSRQSLNRLMASGFSERARPAQLPTARENADTAL
jgi:hypothetical protein